MSTDELKTLYEKYYEKFYIMACRILKDSNAAKDVVHDVFINIYKKPRLDYSQNVKGYIANAVGNTCREYIRSNRNKLLVNNIEIGGEEINSSYIEASVISDLYKDIDRLPQKAKETIKYYLAGQQTKAIAKKLNVSIQCVLNNKQYAIKLLKKHLTTSYGRINI